MKNRRVIITCYTFRGGLRQLLRAFRKLARTYGEKQS